MKKNLTYLFITLGFVFAVWTISKKITLEKNFKKVELACDFTDVMHLSLISGKSIEEVLKDLKEVGITTVGIKETTLKCLEKNALVNIISGVDIEKWRYLFRNNPKFLEATQIQNKDHFLYIFTKNPSLGSFIKKSLSEKLPTKDVTGTFTGKYYLVITFTKKAILNSLHLGFWQGEVEVLKKHGFQIVLKPTHDAFVTPQWIEELFADFKEDASVTGVIIDGIKAPLPEKLGAVLNDKKIPFGVVEFAKIQGQKILAEKCKKVFLCFSPKGENDFFKTTSILRSVKERNIQMVYLHPNNDNYFEFLSFVGGVKNMLLANSFEIGKMKILPRWNAGYLSYVFISIAIFAVIYWLITLIYETPAHFDIGFLIVAVFTTLFFAKFTLFRQLMAFLATLVFPILAISKTWKKHNVPPLTLVILIFLKVTFISLLGAIFVTAILSSSDFMLKINLFRGVKLSLILPLLITFLLLYGREKSYFSTSLERVLKKRLEVRHLLFGSLVIILVVLLIFRSSNQFGFFLPFEETFRIWLEKIFFARPRFKEFLFGHPIMILGFYLYLTAPKDEKIKFRPLILLGLIGQVSIINTFAHIHSPFLIGIFRTLNGIFCGVIVGVLLVNLLKYIKIID